MVEKLGWQVVNGAVQVQIGVPEQYEYRTRILRLESGYLLDQYQPKVYPLWNNINK